jgi:hypothetical protein
MSWIAIVILAYSPIKALHSPRFYSRLILFQVINAVCFYEPINMDSSTCMLIMETAGWSYLVVEPTQSLAMGTCRLFSRAPKLAPTTTLT